MGWNYSCTVYAIEKCYAHVQIARKRKQSERERDKEHAQKKTNQPWTNAVKKKQAIWTDLQPDRLIKNSSETFVKDIST